MFIFYHFFYRETVKDQKELLFQIFEYIRTFQNWIISEVSWFQSIIYYVVSCILCALFTTPKKTTNARVVLFTTQSLNVIIERMIVQFYNNVSDPINDSKMSLVYSIWFVRNSATIICMISLFYAYCSYKDKEYDNYKILKRIENNLGTIQNITRISETSTISKYK